MRLESCVRRDIMMDLEGPHAYCMFISIGLFPLEMMSADAHNMMMSANVHECECAQMSYLPSISLNTQATCYFFQVKVRHHCTNDSVIVHDMGMKLG